MANKILVVANATPIVWASDFDYQGVGGAKTATIELPFLEDARQGDLVELDQEVVINRFPRKFAVTLRMAFENDDIPTAGGSIDLYWASSVAEQGPFLDGMNALDAIYNGTTGSTFTESLRQLQFLGSLILTNDGGSGIVQQNTFAAILPTNFGQPVIVNASNGLLADDGEQLSITFTPYEYEVQ